MKNILPKVLLALCLILLAMNLYNSKTLDQKNTEIAALTEKQDQTEKKVERINEQLEIVTRATKEADASWLRLEDKIKTLEKNKKIYPEKVQEIKNENAEIKALFDTRLPDNLKRLLHQSVQIN